MSSLKKEADKRRMETKKLTALKRESQIIKTFTVKIQDNKLNKIQREYLFMSFVEAKWIRNYIINLINSGKSIFEIKDTDLVDITHLDKDGNVIPVKIKYLNSQSKQDILKSVKAETKSIITKFKKGKGTGKLKFKSDHTSINYKQFGNSFDIKGKNRIRLAKINKPIKVYGLEQIQKLEEQGLSFDIASAKLIKQPDGYFFSITVAIDNDNHYQNVVIEKNKHRSGKIGLDFGCATTLTLSNGDKFNERIEETERYKSIQRSIERCEKGSNNHYKLKQKLRKEAIKISYKKDAKTQEVLNILNKFDRIIMQDEQLSTWQVDGNGKAINHGILGRLKSQLIHSGRYNITVLHKYVETTKLCQKCGTSNDCPTSQRIYECSCGYQKDRDIHAAENNIFFEENIEGTLNNDKFDWTTYKANITKYFNDKK